MFPCVSVTPYTTNTRHWSTYAHMSTLHVPMCHCTCTYSTSAHTALATQESWALSHAHTHPHRPMYVHVIVKRWTHSTYVSPPVASCSKCAQNAFSLKPVVLLLHAHLKVQHAGLSNLINLPLQILALIQQSKDSHCWALYTVQYVCVRACVHVCVYMYVWMLCLHVCCGCLHACMYVYVLIMYMCIYFPSHACACHYLFLQFGLLGFKDRDGLFEGC